jgi:hypothetical protein
MTDLPTLLHDRADRATLSPVDLDAVTRDGERRVRRRRVTTYAGALAVAGAVASTALLGGGATDRALDPASPVPASAASWYLDGRLHHDGTSTDLGIDVATYVRTRAGFVLVDTEDVVWSWTGGEPARVGVAADGPQRLAGDADGDLAAWIDTSGDSGRSEVRVLDQSAGEVTGFVGARDADPRETMVTAVDGDRVWWVEGGRSLTWAVDPTTGAPGTVPERLDDGTRVLAAAAGRIVYELDGEVRTSVGTREGPGYEVLDDQYRDVGALSTDAALWSADADEVGVVRTSDGSAVTLEVDADFSTGYEWLDEDSLVVLAGYGDPDEGGAMTARILVCEVLDGGCTDVSGDLGTFDELQARDFALPVGVEIE